MHLCRSKLKEQAKIMSISLINPWHWADDSFRDPLDWLINHPRNIKRGTYLSNTPGKEVWQYTLPKGFGNLSIIYKYYDYTRFSPLKRFGYSLAVREAQNFAAFKAIGIPVSEILACGENKHCGVCAAHSLFPDPFQTHMTVLSLLQQEIYGTIQN